MSELPLKSTITAVITKSDGYYVASCHEINAVTQGCTFEELEANLQEAVNLYLEDEDPSEFGLLPNPNVLMIYEFGLANARA